MDKQKFGQFIKQARIAKGLTQAELAEKLYIDVTAVSKWERGINFPDISMISDLCRLLGVTEHELIESSKDTEYRQMLYQSEQYKKSRKIVFWAFTSCFIVAVLTCFIVELAVSGRLSWFFIVLSGCACGYWAFFYPVLFPLVKKRTWEGLGRFSLLIYAAGLLFLTLAILFTSHLYAKFDVLFGVKLTLYCFTVLFAYGLVELIPAGRLFKLGTDSILTGIYFVGLAYVLPALMQVEAADYFNVDFTDWAGHTDGNVACIVLSSFALLGAVLIACGLTKKRK